MTTPEPNNFDPVARPDSPVEGPDTGMAGKAMRSVFWVALSRYGNYGVSLVLMATLSRLLSPDDFGLVAMITVLTGFVTILAEAGLSSAIVHHPHWDRPELSTLFWWALFSGGTFTALVWFLSPQFAAFYGDERLVWPLCAAGFGFIVSASSRIHSALLERELRFQEWAIAEFIASAVSAVVAVVAAVMGAGYWTLVIRELTLHSVRFIARLAFTGWVPQLHFKLAVLGEALRYSSGLTAFRSINYWSRSADNLLIGRYLGPASLGYYTRAYALMMYPLDLLTGVIGPVLHPLLQAHRDEPEVVFRFWSQVARLLAMISFPLMACLAVVGDEAISLLWGPGWDESVRVFQVLCIVGAMQPITSATGPLFLIFNRTRQQAVLGIFTTGIFVTGISTGLYFGGLVGTAVGFVVAYPFVATVTLVYVFRTMFKTPVSRLLLLFVTPLLVAALTASLTAVVAWALRPIAPAIVVFAACTLVSSILWVTVLRVREREWMRSIVLILPVRLRPYFQRVFL
jgi:PST family polysaccharide transporter